MKDQIKQRIRKLRLYGMGYKGISTELGLSRDAVRTFCKRNGLDGASSVVSLNYEVNKERNIICTNCGKPIKQKAQGRVRRFCCDDCRRIWWKENSQNANCKDTAIYKFKCKHCGVEFTSYGNKNRKFCSHNCFIKSRFYKEDII